MRFVSWNVNGLRAVLGKGFNEIFAEFDADVFALQETKLQVGQVDMDLPGYHEFWSCAEKKGYSGTAVFSKEAPLQVLHGLGSPYLDAEGRIVALEFADFWFVDVYTPNAQNELARIAHRMEWDDAFRDFCKGLEEGVLPSGVPVERRTSVGEGANDAASSAATASVAAAPGGGADNASAAATASGGALDDAAADATALAAGDAPDAATSVLVGARSTDPGTVYVRGTTQPGETANPKPVVMCGDFNVAHQEIDLKNPGPNRGKAGFSDEERGKFTQLVEAGFTDTFRHLHPDVTGAYSWWSYRFKARKNNAGWRIDYFLVSDALADRIETASIFSEVYGSDHCPVGIELDL